MGRVRVYEEETRIRWRRVGRAEFLKPADAPFKILPKISFVPQIYIYPTKPKNN